METIQLFRLLSEFSPRNCNDREALYEFEKLIKQANSVYSLSGKDWAYRLLKYEEKDHISSEFGATVKWNNTHKKIEIIYRTQIKTNFYDHDFILERWFLKDIGQRPFLKLTDIFYDFIESINEASKKALEHLEMVQEKQESDARNYLSDLRRDYNNSKAQ
jgi:hypothetical protein